MEVREIREIECKSILNKSGITDYCVNPYTGCGNGCVYCYSPHILRIFGRRWGSFVDVKVNGVEVLQKQLRRAKRGEVMLSSVTDPYQALEGKYKITRKILQGLLQRQFPISVLTKSKLVMRDVDLLKQFKDCKVGLTIPFFHDEDRKNFEPGSSSVDERFKALHILKENGVKTFAFFGPVLPFISDKNLETLVRKFSECCDYIYVDRLNIKSRRNWSSVEKVIKENYPDLLDSYRKIFFEDGDYYGGLKRKIKSLAKKFELKVEFVY